MYFITTAWGPSLTTKDRELREYLRREYGREDVAWFLSQIPRRDRHVARKARPVACLLPPSRFASAASS